MQETDNIIYRLGEAIGHMSAARDMFGSTSVTEMIDADIAVCLQAINVLQSIPGSAKRKLGYDGVFCGNCGRRIHYDSVYCDQCGWRITSHENDEDRN